MHWKAPSYATVPKAISRNQYTALCTRAVGSRCSLRAKRSSCYLKTLGKTQFNLSVGRQRPNSNHFTPLDSVCHMPDCLVMDA